MNSTPSPEWNVFKFVITIMFVLFLNYLLPMIFNFMNIGADVYQIYLYWIIAIIVMYMVLPDIVGKNIFKQLSVTK